MLINNGAVKIEIKDINGRLKSVFLSDNVHVGLSRKLIPATGGRKRNSALFMSDSDGQDYVKFEMDGIDGKLFALRLLNNGQAIQSKKETRVVGNLYDNNSANGHIGEVIEVYEFENNVIGNKVDFTESDGVIKAETSSSKIYVYTEAEQDIESLCMNSSSTDLFQMIITCRLEDSEEKMPSQNMEIVFKKGCFENMLDMVFGNMSRSEKEIVFLPTSEPEVILYG